MPPTQEMIENAGTVLENARLESFSTTPTAIRPFQQATLNWRIQVRNTSAPFPGFELVGGGLRASANREGSRVVSPVGTTTYSLRAISGPLSKTLGTCTVQVDMSDCREFSLPEMDLQSDVTLIVDEFLRDKGELRRRRADVVEVESNGIRIALRFKAVIDNWADPDINIDAVISLRVDGGNVLFTLSKYQFDIDFPWWADAAHSAFLPAWLSLALLEGHEERQTRRFLTSRIEAMLARQQRMLEAAGFRVLTLVTRSNEVLVTICPK